MNHSTSNDSEIASGGYPSEPASTLTDLQVKAYENRVREHLKAKCPTRTRAEVRRLERQIEKLVQIYAEGRILLQGNLTDCNRENRRPQGKEQTREIDIIDERE
jgi:hypothetical protein